MAKLYYRYGAMGAGKTMDILKVAYNYEERSQKVIILKPKADTRDGKMTVKSRVDGLEREGMILESFMELPEETIKSYDCILVDEAQFCTKEQVFFFAHVVDDLNVPVICYGLRTDFQLNLFEGSKWLFALADTIEETKTICWCGKKATTNARFNEHGIVKTGEQIMLGGNDSYISLCRKHFCEGNLGPALKSGK
ncbi:MAG: thymidine kinase [Lachnospiraceae bacterium]|nr:thymidine kinase [Lachnospiraceae bacterium]